MRVRRIMQFRENTSCIETKDSYKL